MTEDLIGGEQGDFRSGKGCVDEIFTVKHIGEKAREKTRMFYMNFMDLKKVYR